jgi:hypothetical protein
MKNNSETNEKAQLNTLVDPDLKRTLKTVSAMTDYSIECLTADAFNVLFGAVDPGLNRRKKMIQQAFKAAKSVSEAAPTLKIWGQGSEIMKMGHEMTCST